MFVQSKQSVKVFQTINNIGQLIEEEEWNWQKFRDPDANGSRLMILKERRTG